EDPVEYNQEGIAQIQTHAKIGLTFASALRSILRHDPDVILVGEIRDLETAEMAIHASLTGHMVFSTLHTNDAPSAFTRMIDMGEGLVVLRVTAGVGGLGGLAGSMVSRRQAGWGVVPNCATWIGGGPRTGAG